MFVFKSRNFILNIQTFTIIQKRFIIFDNKNNDYKIKIKINKFDIYYENCDN